MVKLKALMTLNLMTWRFVYSILAISIILISPGRTTAAEMSSPWTGVDVLTNKKVDIQSGKKGTVLVFLSSICPCSKSHLGELRSLAETFKDFQFLAVHTNASEDNLSTAKFFQANPIPFPILDDHSATLANKYHALRTPHAFVIDPQGQILYQGGVSDSSDFQQSSRKHLRLALSELASNGKVETPRTRPLGCTIDRGN